MSPRRRGVSALRDRLPVQLGAANEAGSTPLRQQLTSILRHDILSGVYAPGQRLIERQLVDRFGISSIPVREALQELEAQGLVVKRPNVGCSVINLTRQEVAQAIKLVRVLHPPVICWAAESIVPADMRTLNARADELAAAADTGDARAVFQSALLLQKSIWSIAGNPWASRTLESAIGSLLATSLRWATGKGFLDLRADAAKFSQVVRFLSDRNGPAAAAEWEEIVLGFETQLMAVLSNEGACAGQS